MSPQTSAVRSRQLVGRDRELVGDLTARLPRLHVLATSREPLWVVDELNYRLAPLIDTVKVRELSA